MINAENTHMKEKRKEKKKRKQHFILFTFYLCKIEKNEKEFKRKRIGDLIVFRMWAIFPTNSTQSSLVLYFIYCESFLPSQLCYSRTPEMCGARTSSLTRLLFCILWEMSDTVLSGRSTSYSHPCLSDRFCLNPKASYLRIL